MRSIGIIGTAKNTGKTTTLSVILNSLREKKVAVTGIGYDGEEIDNVTMLPKPRLYFDKSIIVATAEKCIVNSEVEYKLIKKTDIETSLGNVCIVEVTKPGLVVIAGPNKASQLKELILIIKDLGWDYLLVDGSLNRISPMYLLDDLIFTTGGSRSTDISILADEMSTVEKIFSFPLSSYKGDNYSAVTFITDSGIIPADIKTFIDADDVKTLTESVPTECKQILLPVFFSESAITGLIHFLNSDSRFNKKRIEIILLSPVQLLLSAGFTHLRDMLVSFSKTNIGISYIYKPDLRGITINPFFPKLYNYHFVADYLDKELFLNEMRDRLSTPVYNVKESLKLRF